MNDYEAKQEARKQRYLELAENAEQDREAASDRAFDMSRRMAGTPILVGHHSEKNHRAALKRMDNLMSKSCEEGKKAEHYREKAAAVGKGGISSDDPDAVRKLKNRLATLEEKHEKFKVVNRAVRLKDVEKGNARLSELGLSPETIEKLRTPDYMGNIGIPSYTIKNSNANIRRIRKRIERLEKAAAAETKEYAPAEGIRVVENVEANRLQVFFQGKPPAETRQALKRCGFRWAPSKGCWQAYLNNKSRFEVQRFTEV